MNPNESWIAEQARLLMLEDGFGPSSSTKSGGPSGAAPAAMNRTQRRVDPARREIHLAPSIDTCSYPIRRSTLHCSRTYSQPSSAPAI